MTLFAVSIYWDLPVLLVVVSLVYAATRHDRWDKILSEGFGWGLRIALFCEERQFNRSSTLIVGCGPTGLR
jgi:hypothetical protein